MRITRNMLMKHVHGAGDLSERIFCDVTDIALDELVGQISIRAGLSLLDGLLTDETRIRFEARCLELIPAGKGGLWIRDPTPSIAMADGFADESWRKYGSYPASSKARWAAYDIQCRIMLGLLMPDGVLVRAPERKHRRRPERS